MKDNNKFSKDGTREKQYNFLLEINSNDGEQNLGLMSGATWVQDPKRLVFQLSRYKFVSRMLQDFNEVLEIGCADAFGSRIVKQAVSNLTVTDFDPIFIENAKKIAHLDYEMAYSVHDYVNSPLSDKKYNALYALDVLEHINPIDESKFINNINKSLLHEGVAILGMPSKESQIYASKASKEGHVNCKSGQEFKSTMQNYYENVFIFSMNDEVVHTGFYSMANYLIALCVGVKNSNNFA